MNARLIVRQTNVNNQGLALIQVRYTHKSENFHISSGLSIEPKHWDFKTESIRKSKRGYIKLNSILLDKKQQLLDISTSMLLNNVDPTVEKVKNEITGKDVKKNIPPLIKFIEQFIEDSKAVRKDGTIKTYNTSLKYLKSYQEHKRITLNYDDINMDFYYSYISYLHTVKNNSVNGLANKIKTLKTFMERSFDLGYHNCMSYRNRKFTTPRKKVFKIYLTELEIISMLRLDLTEYRILDRHRDFFCISCLTGLRYSDVANLKSQHIKGDFIQLNTVKCGTEVTIPIHRELKSIFKKYQDENGNLFLPKVSNQVLNRSVKEIGLRAKINEEISIKKDFGNSIIEEVVPKWKLITSHTGRRSLISNLVLRGVDSNIICRITGHSKAGSAVFSGYVRISNQEAASTIAKLWEDSSAMRIVA